MPIFNEGGRSYFGMNSQVLGILAGAAITALPALARRWASNFWVRNIALGAGGLALAAGGVHFRAFGSAWPDVALTVVWIVMVGNAFDQPTEPRGLLEGLGVVASAALIVLALMYAQNLAAWIAVSTLIVSSLLLGATLSIGADLGKTGRRMLGFGLAAAGIAVGFPGRPALSTALIPLVVLGIPLANLALSLAGRARKSLPASPGTAGREYSLAGVLRTQGWSDRGAAGLLWAGGLGLGVSAIVMSRLDPFAALALALLSGATCLAGIRARQIAGSGPWPVLIFGFGAATLLTFIFSLRYHFLDFVFAGTHSGYQGFDFFQMPCAFYFLARGVNPYGAEGAACGYAPWAAPFLLHPLAAIMPGAVLYVLPPWIAYIAFTAFSVFAALGLYLLFARLAPNSLWKSLIFLCLAANWPFYLLLWMGQAQIFVLLSFGLIAYALLRQPAGWSRQSSTFLIAGLLIGLLTKPLLAPMVVVLLVARETRKATIIGLIGYGLISLGMLAIPAVNPGAKPISDLLNGTVTLGDYLIRNGNLGHWVYIAVKTPGPPSHAPGAALDVFSLATTVSAAWSRGLPGMLLRLGAGAIVLFQAWAVATARSSAERLRQVLLAGMLVALMYVVIYPEVYEYHYATLSVTAAVFLLMLPDAADRQARLWLIVGLAAFVPFLLPSIFPLVMPNGAAGLSDNEILAQATVYRAFRVAPALIMFFATGLAMLRYRASEKDKAAAAAPAALQENY